ncbi:hypothetical protein NTG1052_390003 [Candidatus Nitrotoga sp. 1052]|nr:hypothetical protein NTG1052_390003 [Candidatus Nitrotoga sp. 1052]
MPMRAGVRALAQLPVVVPLLVESPQQTHHPAVPPPQSVGNAVVVHL